MNAPIDLRSDTISKPSEAMRPAMAAAEVGDDWYGDDPTVNRLQDQAAELTGKEAAAYLPTGTMCNQVAMHAFARAGHFVVCEASAQVGGSEVASAAVGGGSVLPVADIRAIAAACAARGVPLYLDGARIFNACAVTGATGSDFAAEVSAMMFCLSKGLGAPIGSVVAGDAEFIREVRRLKILFGGAWRQAGIMAAAGLIALRDGPGRLHEDHVNARRLAEGIAELLPASVDPASVATNIVFVQVSGTGRDVREWVARLAAEGVLVTAIGDRIRMLTHVDITADDIEAALGAWRRAAAPRSDG